MTLGLHNDLQKHYGDKFSREVWVNTQSAIARYRYRSLWKKEVGTVGWIRQFKDDTVFLDIGSNVGVYSLAAYMAGVSAVYSIDPLPHNIFELCNTIHQNSISNIFPICARIASNNNVVSASPDQKHVEKFKPFGYKPSRFGDYAGAGITMQESIIPRCSLTPSLNRKNFEQIASLGITDIKIDVDGAEIDVLENLYPLFKSPSFRSVAVEVRASTLTKVDGILGDLSLSEHINFRKISKYEKRLKKDCDVMVLYTR